MAQLQISSSEPLKIIELIEQLVPGVKLDALTSMLAGIQLTGSFTLAKKVSADETVTLQVTITPDK